MNDELADDILKANPQIDRHVLQQSREFRSRLKANGLKGAKYGLAVGGRQVRVGRVSQRKG